MSYVNVYANVDICRLITHTNLEIIYFTFINCSLRDINEYVILILFVVLCYGFVHENSTIGSQER